MFERFTERARQVVVFAQDEARALKHNYIGTEHILLGLLREEEGLAARVLESLDITVEEVRAQVARIVGQGDEVTTGQIPFTPRAKKVLELALARPLASATTTSAPSTSCSASSARTRASPRGSCSTSTPTPRRSATRSSACSPARAAASRAAPPAAPPRSRRARSCSTSSAATSPSCARGQARPGHRPPDGDRARHPDPVPPHEEQPGADRRARRRQDRDRRGPRRSGSPANQSPSS